MALAAAATLTGLPAAPTAPQRPDPAGSGTPAPVSQAAPDFLWQADLDRGLARAIAICAVIGVAAFTLDPTFADRYSTTLAITHAGFALAAAGCVADVLCGARTRRGAQVFAALGVALCAVMPLLFPPDPQSAAYPPFIHVLGVAVLATPYAFSPGAGVVASFVLAAALLHERVVTVGAAQGRWEALSYLGAGLVGVTVFVLLRTRAGQVADETRRTRLAEEADAREAATTRERDRWDSLVHDTVLGALLTAARSPNWSTERAGQDLARDALHALDAPEGRPRLAFLPAIRRRAEALGLTLELHDQTSGPFSSRRRVLAIADDVAEALTDATTEALTNIARHAGVDRAAVTVLDGPAGRRVVVRDDGCGFDPQGDPGPRAGLRNIRARLHSVGGSASVDSTPGGGTSVVLDVPRAGAQADGVPAHVWTPRTFRPALACAALCLLGHAAIGVLWIDRTLIAWVTAAGLVATLLAMTVAWSGSCAERCCVVWVLVGIGIPTMLALNLVDPQQPDWRWWFVGYQNLLVATLAFRGNTRAAFAIALGMPVVMGLAVFLTHGTVPLAALLGACPQVLVWAFVGSALRRALDSAAATIKAAERARSELRLVRSLREVREAERAERWRELGSSVVPMLRRLCRPADLSEQQRSTCRLLEAAARDRLVARCLVTPRVAAAVLRGRQLGANVEIVATVDDSGQAVAAFRDLVAALLQVLDRDTTFRATWRQRDGAPVGTVVIVTDGGASSRVEPAVARLRRRLPGFAVDTSYDEAAGLVVLRPR